MDLESLYRTLVPTNARFLLETALGNRAPITEKDFQPEEIQTLRDLYHKRVAYNNQRLAELQDTSNLEASFQKERPQKAVPTKTGWVFVPMTLDEYRQKRKEAADSYVRTMGKTSMGYSDYDIPPEGQNWWTSIMKSYTDPKFNLSSTLGSFNAYDEGDKIRIQDTYKFDNRPFYGERSLSGLGNIIQRGYNSPGSLFDMLMMQYMPDAKRTVDFTIDK